MLFSVMQLFKLKKCYILKGERLEKGLSCVFQNIESTLTKGSVTKAQATDQQAELKE